MNSRQLDAYLERADEGFYYRDIARETRRARKPRQCDSCCRPIQAGEVYTRSVYEDDERKLRSWSMHRNASDCYEDE